MTLLNDWILRSDLRLVYLNIRENKQNVQLIVPKI